MASCSIVLGCVFGSAHGRCPGTLVLEGGARPQAPRSRDSRLGLLVLVSHPSQVLLVGLLGLSAHLLWAQRTPPLDKKVPIQVFDTPAPFARPSEAQASLHLAYRLPLIFEQNQNQTKLRMKFFPPCAGCYRPLTSAHAPLCPVTRTIELSSGEKYLAGGAPSNRFPFAPTYDNALQETTSRAEDWEHYTHNIPWAGSIILRIYRQAKAHPHVTRVLTALQPAL